MTKGISVQGLNQEYFSATFCRKYEKWKKEVSYYEGKRACSKTALGKLLGVSRIQVDSYFKGREKPSQIVLDRICSVFDCSMKDFFPQTHEAKYSYSDEEINKVSKDLLKFSREIGFSPTTLLLSKELTDFENDFPLYAPLKVSREIKDFDNVEYTMIRNNNFANSAQTEKSSLYQIEKNGKIITLSYCDIIFLKELQDRIQNTILEAYKERHNEMETELKAANKIIKKQAIKKDKNNLLVEVKPNFTEDDYLKVDRLTRKLVDIKNMKGEESNG